MSVRAAILEGYPYQAMNGNKIEIRQCLDDKRYPFMFGIEYDSNNQIVREGLYDKENGIAVLPNGNRDGTPNHLVILPKKVTGYVITEYTGESGIPKLYGMYPTHKAATVDRDIRDINGRVAAVDVFDVYYAKEEK